MKDNLHVSSWANVTVKCENTAHSRASVFVTQLPGRRTQEHASKKESRGAAGWFFKSTFQGQQQEYYIPHPLAKPTHLPHISLGRPDYSKTDILNSKKTKLVLMKCLMPVIAHMLVLHQIYGPAEVHL